MAKIYVTNDDETRRVEIGSMRSPDPEADEDDQIFYARCWTCPWDSFETDRSFLFTVEDALNEGDIHLSRHEKAS